MSSQVKADKSKVKIFSDTERVGQNISTKSVGSNKRLNITNTYKYPEGETHTGVQVRVSFNLT